MGTLGPWVETRSLSVVAARSDPPRNTIAIKFCTIMGRPSWAAIASLRCLGSWLAVLHLVSSKMTLVSRLRALDSGAGVGGFGSAIWSRRPSLAQVEAREALPHGTSRPPTRLYLVPYVHLVQTCCYGTYCILSMYVCMYLYRGHATLNRRDGAPDHLFGSWVAPRNVVQKDAYANAARKAISGTDRLAGRWR